MKLRSSGGVAASLVGLGVLAAASPAVTAVGPIRRRVAPRLAGASSGSHMALTFDDGPDPASTPAFLDLLARHDRRATFFVLGAQAQETPSLVRRMVDEGHEVAVHGWRHRCTAVSPPTQLLRELRAARHVVEDVTGQSPSWYRPPYGVMSAEAWLASRELGLAPVLWTAWGRDWERSATPGRIVSTVLRTLRPGGTILLHDTDLHGRGDWRRSCEATARLLSGALARSEVGPLRDHWR